MDCIREPVLERADRHPSEPCNGHAGSPFPLSHACARCFTFSRWDIHGRT
ncbi:hypothetical protein ACHAXR_001064 [Thalassiosira sp. AJA248-18]